ncbi:MAG TPA: hypothetical protein VGC76_15545 [Pyrinomonadaceae bacterium]|jgi:hypothetical protein
MKDESTTAMNYDITDAIANLMVNEDENLPARLREQEKNLKKEKCVDAKIGRWIKNYKMSVLIDILDSTDEYFHENFPGLKSFNRAKRQEFAKEVQKHGKICPHCKLKIFYDSKWEKETEKFVFKHGERMKEFFTNKEEFFNPEI